MCCTHTAIKFYVAGCRNLIVAVIKPKQNKMLITYNLIEIVLLFSFAQGISIYTSKSAVKIKGDTYLVILTSRLCIIQRLDLFHVYVISSKYKNHEQMKQTGSFSKHCVLDLKIKMCTQVIGM